MKLSIALTLLLCAFQAADTPRDKALASLVGAERSFAAASKAKGLHQAFVEYMADDGLVFAPQPVNGKKLHAGAPASKALLTWYPAYADISGSLDWGYTTGPYEIRLAPEAGQPAGAGFYLSVWRKQPDGRWKVAIDMGNTFDVSLIKEEAYKPAPDTPGAAKGKEADLLAKDQQPVQPYVGGTLLYRAGAYPSRYSAAPEKPAADVVYTTLGHDISAAADMAFTYGSYTRGAGEGAEAGYYLKIWHVLDGQWQLAAHNLVPNRKP